MSARPDMNEIVGTHDLVMITLDTLRFDVADRCMRQGRLPHFEAWFSAQGWGRYHSPASFTYAAHHAFFSGFLPTPAKPGSHPRHFAAKFKGSATTVETTCVLARPRQTFVMAFGDHGTAYGEDGFWGHRLAHDTVMHVPYAETFLTD